MNKQPAVTPRKLLAIAGMGWLFDAMDVEFYRLLSPRFTLIGI